MSLLAYINAWADDDLDDEVVGTSILTDSDEEMLEEMPFSLSPAMLMLIAGALLLFFLLNKLKVKKGCWYCIAYFVGVYMLVTRCT